MTFVAISSVLLPSIAAVGEHSFLVLFCYQATIIKKDSKVTIKKRLSTYTKSKFISSVSPTYVLYSTFYLNSLQSKSFSTSSQLRTDDNRDLPMEDNRDLSDDEAVDHVESTNAISTRRTRQANIPVVTNVDDPNSKLHTDAMTGIYFFKKLLATPKGQELEENKVEYIRNLLENQASGAASSSSVNQPNAPAAGSTSSNVPPVASSSNLPPVSSTSSNTPGSTNSLTTSGSGSSSKIEDSQLSPSSVSAKSSGKQPESTKRSQDDDNNGKGGPSGFSGGSGPSDPSGGSSSSGSSSLKSMSTEQLTTNTQLIGSPIDFVIELESTTSIFEVIDF